MKAHIAAAAPRAYYYGITDGRAALLEVLNGFGITASAIAPGQPVRTVAQLDEPCAAAPVSGPAESLLLLDGVDGPALQALLAALRAREVSVDYKAVVTPHNRSWTVLELMEELKRERRAIREAQKQ